MRKFTVVKVTQKIEAAKVTGFSVQVAYLPGSDEMFEILTHPAVFTSQARAQAFSDKIESKVGGHLQGLNWDAWLWEVQGMTCPFEKLRTAPIAKPFLVA